MARIRSVKPEFWEDEAIALLSRDARLLFIATWNLADDEGLLRWTPEYIKAQVFMYDEDITVEAATRLMSEIAGAGLVHPYRGGKLQQKLGWIVNFLKHQRPNRPQPSKLPPPSVQNPQVKRAYAERDGWTCHICGDEIEVNPKARPARLASLDHLEPRSNGGSDYPSNIKVAHFGCNSSKGTNPLTDDSVNDSVNDSEQDPEYVDEPLTPVGEGRGGGVERTIAPAPPPRKRSRKTPKPREPDPIFDAVVTACGIDPSELTDTARGATNKAVKELRAIGATPDGIRARASVHLRKWPEATLTPSSLAKNYAQLGASPRGSPSGGGSLPEVGSPEWEERRRESEARASAILGGTP